MNLTFKFYEHIFIINVEILRILHEVQLSQTDRASAARWVQSIL